MQYLVNEIYATIQGEGTKTGVPMVIVRLQGCNLRCPWCDTKYSWPEGGMVLDAETIVEKVKQFPGIEWTMLTGGEPTTQVLGPLCNALHEAGKQIALETNGILPLSGLVDWLCISPKLSVPGGAHINTQTLFMSDELKFVIGDQQDLVLVNQFLRDYTSQLLRGHIQICLQPMSQSVEATKLCYEECVKKGWRLSVQLHKFINIR